MRKHVLSEDDVDNDNNGRIDVVVFFAVTDLRDTLRIFVGQFGAILASGFSQILHTKPRWIFLSSKPEIKQSITQQQRELSDKHLQFSSIFNRKTQQDCAFFFNCQKLFRETILRPRQIAVQDQEHFFIPRKNGFQFSSPRFCFQLKFFGYSM